MPETESVVETQPFHAKNLLSTHFLNVHLKTMDEWLETEEAEKAFRCIRNEYEKHKDELPTCNESQLEDKLIKPVLKCLDHHFEVQALALSGRPDYAFFADEESAKEAVKRQKKDDFYLKTIAVGDAKVWEEPLDRFRGGRPVYERSNPSYQIDTYLRATPPRWAVLTNGRYWRLYCEDTSYRGDSYYEIDLVQLIEDDDVENFKYFYLFFRRQAFESDGRSFLDKVHSGSLDYAKDLGESLKENVYQAMKTVAEGFFDWIENKLTKEPPQVEVVRENTMKLLYRLLFILYAESRGLLDLSNKDYAKMSLHALKREISQRMDRREARSKLQSAYWGRLEDLFILINQGSEALGFSPDILNVPPYNGDLFDPGRSTFLRDKKVSDFYLAPAIDLLARSVERNRGKAMIDYSTLDIRHLGSIYEGLLEYRLEIAEEDMVAVRIRGREKWQKKNDATGKFVDEARSGTLYVATDKQERKVTGSYYTPEHIVKYIVENALGPVVRHKLEEAEGCKSESILEIKVLDPAMGSGHFLVEAVDFLAKHLVEAVEKDIEEDLLPEREYSAEWAKREVASHCIYGVDRNPMAVELAKVSLWLKTISKDKPLSFLDHRLKCGNSLIGSRMEELPDYPEPKKGTTISGEGYERFEVDVRKPFVKELLKKVNELESGKEETIADIKRKEGLFQQLRKSKEYERIKAFADVYTSVFFDNPTGKDYYNNLLWALRGGKTEWEEKTGVRRFRKAMQIADEERFFHWELEFPEVFFGLGSKDNPGFDVVIGNPPWGEIKQNREKEYFKKTYSTLKKGKVDIFPLFVTSSITLTKMGGSYGVIIPNTLLYNPHHQPIRKSILKETSINIVYDLSKYVFEDAPDTVPAILICAKKKDEKHVVHVKQLVEKSGLQGFISGKKRIDSTVDQSVFVRESTNKFNPRLSMPTAPIFNRMTNTCVELRELCIASQGIKPYATKEEKKEHQYLSYESSGDNWIPALRGRNIGRYSQDWDGEYVLYGDWLYSRPRDAFEGTECMFYQRLRKASLFPRLVACLANTKEVKPLAACSVVTTKKESGVDIKFILPLVNSRLINEWYRFFDTDVEIKIQSLLSIPIPRISFTTSRMERGSIVDELKDEYLKEVR